MSKKKVAVHLHSGRARTGEIEKQLIVRGALEIEGQGGRNLLCKILKGSKDAKVLSHGLDACSVYGSLKDLTLDEISRLVDSMIRGHWLCTVYSGRLPMIGLTEKGRILAEQVLMEELLEEIRMTLQEPDPELLHALAEKITGYRKEFRLELVPMVFAMDPLPREFLNTWKEKETRALKAVIHQHEEFLC